MLREVISLEGHLKFNAKQLLGLWQKNSQRQFGFAKMGNVLPMHVNFFLIYCKVDNSRK